MPDIDDFLRRQDDHRTTSAASGAFQGYGIRRGTARVPADASRAVTVSTVAACPASSPSPISSRVCRSSLRPVPVRPTAPTPTVGLTGSGQ